MADEGLEGLGLRRLGRSLAPPGFWFQGSAGASAHPASTVLCSCGWGLEFLVFFEIQEFT